MRVAGRSGRCASRLAMSRQRQAPRASAQRHGSQVAGLGPDASKLGDPIVPERASADPLNNGPCGDLYGGTCWVPKALITGSLVLGACFPVLVHQYCIETAERYLWIGAALGALWEAPLSTPGWRTDPGKLLRLFKPFNLAMLILWCVWDGVLLLVGWWLCQAGAAYLQHALSAPAQLAVHIAWGQLSSLAVEAIAAATGMWAYEPAGWNVSVLRLPNGKHLTVLPQAIWVVASTAFWTITLLL